MTDKKNISYKNSYSNKVNGEFYTPKELSDFLAKNISDIHSYSSKKTIRILDPSIGDGKLSISLINEIRKKYKGEIILFAFDINSSALEKARNDIKKNHPDCILYFRNESFLDFFSDVEREKTLFDFIIANPPYVRIQIMREELSQQLSRVFNIEGKVDLYHFFLLAMIRLLDPSGTIGFIVSNRFMTTKGSRSLRKELYDKLTIRKIWDLGDTRLFNASVLPAVVIANGKEYKKHNITTGIGFTSIYETKSSFNLRAKNPILALSKKGVIKVDDGRHFLVKSGSLDVSENIENVWRISTNESNNWIKRVRKNTAYTFGEIGDIHVGVKTCSDKVFIRHDWNMKTNGKIPELLKPVITHHNSGRYRSIIPKEIRYILYPYSVINGKKVVDDLDKFPNSRKYLESNRKILEKRTYLIKSGKKWYEIWVSPNPLFWSCPKLVFRDITIKPTFWIDLDGNIVNGDCYWMVLKDETRVELLWLAVAVANSTFIEEFYDYCFHNKLYSGSRRFITQYVKHFPLPDPNTPLSKEIIENSKKIYNINHAYNTRNIEERIDDLVWISFGFKK